MGEIFFLFFSFFKIPPPPFVKGETIPEPRYEIPNLHITRAEIVSPLADAVGFIHSDETHFYSLDDIQKLLAVEPFRCDIDELDRVLSRVTDLF